MHQDPVLSRTKLIAEPWDIGFDGYRLGGFPPAWSEWNDRYRDCVRRFWRGDPWEIGALATRLCGSSDIFNHNGRSLRASINFVTAHDGFTLNDLVSYNYKHNLDNGEDNRDGSNHNLSNNWGHEGPTEDQGISEIRRRIVKNFIATLGFSFGVPMISQGDEIGRSQRGNNNAYCQDSDISWVDWQLDDERRELFEFCSEVFRLRKRYSFFKRKAFFKDPSAVQDQSKEVAWLHPEGHEMTGKDWHDPGSQHCLGMLLLATSTQQSLEERDRSVSLLFVANSSGDDVFFKLPDIPDNDEWTVVLQSAKDGPGIYFNEILVRHHSVVVIEQRRPL
ncbi:MAG: hypothetical protein IPJ88_01255 [Myxococcales bacterium]|nr:MAG: hypothetical protein IPJ88_01255 [Myxococcales bacterium]